MRGVGHGAPRRRGEARRGGEDRGRGEAQRRWETTRSALSDRQERVTRLDRGVGARAGARRGETGGYEEGARHLIRAWGDDVEASVHPAGLSVVVHRGALVFLGVERDRGLGPPGAGSRTSGAWLMRRGDARGGGEKSWGLWMRGRGSHAWASAVARGVGKGAPRRQGAHPLSSVVFCFTRLKISSAVSSPRISAVHVTAVFRASSSIPQSPPISGPTRRENIPQWKMSFPS